MDPPGGGSERRRQAERLRREEAYYNFINELSEEEYRLMRDGNLLGTPGEVTAEELRQRLDGAKERVSSQPHTEQQSQTADAGDQQSSGSGGEERGAAGRGGAGGAEPGAESSNGDSLLEWLNTFRRTGNATRSGQSGNQTWRAVSRTNPNSGEFRFSLEININHDQPEPGEHIETVSSVDAPELPVIPPNTSVHNASPLSSSRPSATPRPAPYPSPRPAIRRIETRRTRSSATALSVSSATLSPAEMAPAAPQRRGSTLHSSAPSPAVPSPPADQTAPFQQQVQNVEVEPGRSQTAASIDCPRVPPQDESQHQAVGQESRSSRTRSRGRARRTATGSGAASRASRRSRSPLNRTSSVSSTQPRISGTTGSTAPPGDPSGVTTSVSMETGGIVSEPDAVLESAVETVERASESPAAGAGSSAVRRHPTIMLDLQVRRIRPGENRDRDSIASRTRSRARVAENTVTFESDSGGFRRTISRSERAGIRTYVSTIRIPLRRISETGLGEPNSTALRSILRQIMTGFGELSSLMETEASSESVTPSHGYVGVANGGSSRLHLNESGPNQVGTSEVVQGVEGQVSSEEEQVGQARLGAGVVSSADGRSNSRDTNNLVENGTLPILRLAHFFLLNDEEDDEHPRGLTKEQIDNLSTRTYGQASLEGEIGRACSVCINEYAQGNKLRRLPCSHEFHVHCIDRWLSENNTCPICRQPILAAHHD
ncbi:PREDICTED: E3 ubiquitin-protein ligase RNF6 isoform X1 [Cyprinodon variegatus]|uniref:RING-type E3 ubiquitin transferase n=1 Tax=Cyprinodon variegatus TaxID=28743 RepID=A0A3Q2CME2_CYPVA|nr:PREDICTED: E3 ubiquitin-protein ligase RNF6 isoform X1 [Cyprinodon variegatus]XP_015257415.1 PREDICTED: E3 ubiquitin-protein ligase RNF6 isoform X1 [Cyprinodon variegatus]XP_015257416.1 PREDICTED: E3 ubiquitin-protein ligase RNF6 isoform X1 [Cyprinodon variegatus]